MVQTPFSGPGTGGSRLATRLGAGVVMLERPGWGALVCSSPASVSATWGVTQPLTRCCLGAPPPSTGHNCTIHPEPRAGQAHQASLHRPSAPTAGPCPRPAPAAGWGVLKRQGLCVTRPEHMKSSLTVREGPFQKEGLAQGHPQTRGRGCLKHSETITTASSPQYHSLEGKLTLNLDPHTSLFSLIVWQEYNFIPHLQSRKAEAQGG